ncbi:MAG: hypothetical protein ABFS28_02165 [Bacteroidota bacterium]
MIYLFRVVSDEDQNFYRDVIAEGSDTFLELHQTLQENLGYDANQLASFFITNEMWEKQKEITLIDMMQDPNLGTTTMDQVTLEEYLTEINQRMIYVFDFFAERAFFLELIETTDQTSPKETPFIGQGAGDPPPQLAMDLLVDEPESMPDADMEEDEQDDLRLDDLDPDLFNTGMPEDF